MEYATPTPASGRSTWRFTAVDRIAQDDGVWLLVVVALLSLYLFVS